MADDANNDRLLQPIETLRDRIRVQLHLASMDAKDEYARLEKRFNDTVHDIEVQREKAAGTANEAAKTVDETAKNVLDDLRAGYEKLAEQLGAK